MTEINSLFNIRILFLFIFFHFICIHFLCNLIFFYFSEVKKVDIFKVEIVEGRREKKLTQVEQKLQLW